VPFYEDITGNFMVYQHRTETYLLQLFAHPETSDCFFYNFWYYFWGQHRCWTETSI